MAKTHEACGDLATAGLPLGQSALRRGRGRPAEADLGGGDHDVSRAPTSTPCISLVAATKLALTLIVSCGLVAAGCGRSAKPVETTPTGALLKVEMGKAAKLDPESALRCFVHGQFVGMQTPAQCAVKNGVPAGALDVGLDQSGSLAAGVGDAHLAPIANTMSDHSVVDDEPADSPSTPALPTLASAPPDGALPADGQTGDCLRYSRGAWQAAAGGVALGACIHTLFAGRCVSPGQALYGRWGRETVRLTPGRVEVSDNNRDFHLLAAQSGSDCSLPPL